MKQSALTILLICILCACKKEKCTNDHYDKFSGSWEFEQYSGYPFTNNSILPPGNGQIIILRKDGTFERRKHDTLLFKGTYILQEKNDCLQPANRITHYTTSENTFNESYIQLQNNKLTLSTPNCYQDGGTEYYRRMKDR